MKNFHKVPFVDVLGLHNTNVEFGLTSADVVAIRRIHGINKLVEDEKVHFIANCIFVCC